VVGNVDGSVSGNGSHYWLLCWCCLVNWWL
jgi:hypothetical protein